MAGIKALRKIQIGDETTPGTNVAATTIWRGVGTLEDAREIVFVEEDIGRMPNTLRTLTMKTEGRLTMEATPANVQQIPHIFNAAIKQVSTPSTGDTGSGKVWIFDFPTTTANTIQTYSIEGGDNQQAEEMSYAFVKSFRLSGEGGQSWMISADWIGREVSTTSFSTGATVPTVTSLPFSRTSAWIDPATAIGTTAVTQTLLSAELNCADTGIVAVYTGDGNSRNFSFIKVVPADMTFTLTFEHNDVAVAEIAAWRAETERAIRMVARGELLQTQGTVYTSERIILDLYGKWESVEKIGERDGNDVVTATLRTGYSVAQAKATTITVVNELAALP